MGSAESTVAENFSQSVVPSGKTRICVAGFKKCPYVGRTHHISALIARSFPDKYETWYYFDEREKYYDYLGTTFDKVPFPQHLKGHSTAPFVWLEQSAPADTPADDPFLLDKKNLITKLIGGNSHFQEWVTEIFSGNGEQEKQLLDLAKDSPSLLFDTNHVDKYGPQTAAEAN